MCFFLITKIIRIFIIKISNTNVESKSFPWSLWCIFLQIFPPVNEWICRKLQNTHYACIISQLLFVILCHSMCLCGFFIFIFVSVVISRNLLFLEVYLFTANHSPLPHTQPLCLFRWRSTDTITISCCSRSLPRNTFYLFISLPQRPYLLFAQNFSVALAQ